MQSNTTLIHELHERVEGGADDRRIEPRVVTIIPAKVKGLHPLTSSGPSQQATIVEVSQRGLALMVDRGYLPGATVQVFVSKEIFVGKVLHCTAAGAEFVIGVELRGGILA